MPIIFQNNKVKFCLRLDFIFDFMIKKGSKNIGNGMQGLFENLAALGRTKLMILFGAGAAMVLALILGLSAASKPEYAPIFSNLSPTSASSIEAALTNGGFNALISDDGTAVSVPRSDAGRARMVLAETGIPIDGDPGWELFDDSSGLAMNSFLQKINKARAMEGELARSIQTLNGIASARVHLVLPDREPFSRDTPSPRASIILRPAAGGVVSRKQAEAVRNLVASSVAGLDLSKVTVLSASGDTILAEGSEGAGQTGIQTAKTAAEDRLAQELQSILTARVGAGNARVHVNVELTSEREVIVEQSFDPDQQVVRSTETKSRSQSDTKDNGNVGVENNIPAALTGGGETGAKNSKSESGESVQYEIGNTRREVVREAGDIKRISVAVLVNGIYNAEGSDVVYSERSPEELARLQELIQSAVGFDEVRGDSVSVDSMRFMDYSMDLGDPITQSIGSRISDSIVPIIRGVVALLIVALVMILGVRPLLRTVRESHGLQNLEAAALAGPGGGAGSILGTDRQAASLAPGSDKLLGNNAAAEFDLEEPDEYIRTQGIRGNIHKRNIEKIQNLVDEKPDEVLRVIRSWLPNEVDA